MQQVAHPFGLVSDDADTHKRCECVRGRHLRHKMAARLRVGDDEVVVVLTNFVAKFADGKDLFDGRRSVRDEVKDASQRSKTADDRHTQIQPDVFA